MCGICGEVHFSGDMVSPAKVMAMAERLAPRGPDASGLVFWNRAAFGHRRLKILDLSEHARQPMDDPALGLTIVFNGCIYNFRELRQALQTLGYSFFSQGDTEVVLKAFHAWGPECVHRFHGMFAFAVLERDSGRLTLVRDRLGIKPLYLAYHHKSVLFASSLPALLAAGGLDTSLNPEALHHYLTFHAVVPSPHTLLNGIQKLPPATIATFSADGERQDQCYWKPLYQQQAGDAERSQEAWQALLLTALRQAVQRRLVADVPVGVLLSGGLDSSLIVGLLSEAGQSGIHTFSVGFEAAGKQEGDEFRYSDIIAQHFQTQHHQIRVSNHELAHVLPDVIQAMSEPMVSHDNVGFYLLSREVSQHVKVVQSGQGADEVFAGYYWYPPMVNSTAPVTNYTQAFFDRDHAELRNYLHPAWVNQDYSRAFVREHFAQPGADDPVDKALRLDTTVMLVDDPVKRVDNMSMAWGLEARVPFLDHELVELAARMPARHKLASGGKGILKDAARQVIPAAVIDRPKGYFPVPALTYPQGPVLSMMRDALGSQRARERALFNPDIVAQLLANPKNHHTPLRGSKLWQVALLEMWLQSHGI